MTETLLYLLYQAAGLAPMIPLDQELRPTWLFGKTVHEGCDRGSYYEQADFAHEYGSPKCLVRIGCWGPVVNCNVTKRGWMAGIGGCPNVGGICIGCTMPGFPDKFMPFMDEPPGGVLSSSTDLDVRQADPQAPVVSPTPRSTRSRSGGTAGLSSPPAIIPPPTAPARGRRHHHGHRDHSGARDQERRLEPGRDVVGPVTRIVGSLGIYTKIDFANRQVAECHSTSSIFRGYSIFMKGKDPRDAHFITSRICGICGDNHATCACYAQNMAFGIRPPAMGEWIVNLGEAAEYMFDHNIFQDNLVGVDFCEQMVKETNPSVWDKAQKHPRAARRDPPLQDDRRHHAGPQPIHRRVLPRSPPDEPHDPGDVLPDGRAARPPLDAVPRRRRHRPHAAALHRLPRPADEVRRVHEAGRPAPRRPLRLLLRGACRATRRSAVVACCSAAGARSTIPTSATTRTGTWTSGAGRCTSRRASSSTARR